MGGGEGTTGIGAEGMTKYPAEGAPVIKNGGNSEDQDGVVKEQDPKSFYGGDQTSVNRSKGK